MTLMIPLFVKTENNNFLNWYILVKAYIFYLFYNTASVQLDDRFYCGGQLLTHLSSQEFCSLYTI
jgi:hypothetical protein